MALIPLEDVKLRYVFNVPEVRLVVQLEETMHVKWELRLDLDCGGRR